MTTQPKRPKPVTENRTLHFDLSGSPSGVEHTLHLGSRSFTLKAHNDATRAMYRQQVPLLNHVPDHRLTHYAEDVTARTTAIQSFYVNHPHNGEEFPVLSLAGILVPKSVARWAHQHHGLETGLYSSKVRRLGLGHMVTPNAAPQPPASRAQVALKAKLGGPPTLQSVSISVSQARSGFVVGQGETLQFKATGNYSDGSTQDLTSSAAWSSSDTSLATVTAGLATGSATSLGTLTITATSGSVSGSAVLTVVPAWLTTGDLSSILDFGDAAQFAVYHHSELLTLTTDATQPGGSVTALTILAAIENTTNFQIFEPDGTISGLVGALAAQGYAQQPGSEYVGWANAEVLKVKKGEPFTYGEYWPSAGPSKKRTKGWAYVYTTRTITAMQPVVQQALLAVRNMEELDGISYQIDFGTNSFTANGSEPSPVSLDRVTGRRKPAVRTAALLGDGSGGLTYTLTDSDFTCGREVSITGLTPPANNPPDTGPTVEFTVSNSYFRHLGIWVRCLDSDNNPIAVTSIPGYKSTGPDTTFDWYLTWLEPANRILGIPISNAETDTLTVTLPLNATSVLIQCAGLGSIFLPDIQSNLTYPGTMNYVGWAPTVAVPGALMTGVIDLALPAFFLLWGIAAEELEGAKELINGLAEMLVKIAAGGIFDAVFDETIQGSSGATMLTSWGKDVLTIIFSEAPAEIAKLLAWAAEVSAADALFECLPVVGEIFEALSAANTALLLTETVAGTLLSNTVILDTFIVTQNVTVQVFNDPSDYQYPASATQIQIVLKPGSGTPFTYEASLGTGCSLYPTYPSLAFSDPPTDKQAIPIQYTFTGVPIGCTIEIDVTLIAPNSGTTGDWVAATGTVVAPLGGPASPTLSITLIEKPVPLTGTSQYSHVQKLTYTNGQYVWDQTTTPPSATITSLTPGTSPLQNLVDIAIVTPSGTLGYVWGGISSQWIVAGGQPSSGQILYTMQNIGLSGTNPNTELQILGDSSGGQVVGYTAPILLAYNVVGTDGTGFIVAQAVDPANPKNGPEYHAFQVSFTSGATIDLSSAQSWGKFASQSICKVVYHPSGFLLALNSGAEKVEYMPLPSQPYASISDAPYANQTGGAGSYIGLLNGSRSIAVTADGHTFLVLEPGNQRIQAFTVKGTSVNYFTDSEGNPTNVAQLYIPNPDDTIVWLDMSVDPTGYIYVLSYTGGGSQTLDYQLDVYTPSGSWLFRTRGVTAGQLAVDAFRVLYTENYEMITGPNDCPQPSVSEWTAS